MSPEARMSPGPAPWRAEVAATASLAAPLVGGQVAHVGLNFIDTLMAGRIGPAELAAVALGSSVWSAVGLFTMGVLMAVPPSVAQLVGGDRRERIAPLIRQAFWMALGLSVVTIAVAANLRPLLEALDVEPEIVPTVVGYPRALAWGIPALCGYLILRFLSEGLGSSRPTLYFGWIGLPVNIFANWVLMYGHFGVPELGAVGCGYATAIVWWAQFGGIALYIARGSRYRGLGLFAQLEPPDARRIRELLGIGLPVGVALFIEGSLFSVVALLIGTLGTEAVAGHQVAINFAALTFMVPLGISMAITVRVGFAVGRGDRAGARRAAFVGAGLALTSQVISASVMVFLPRHVARIYTDDPAVIAIAVSLLLLAAIFQISDGIQVSAAGALRGLKDTRRPMLITVVAYWLVGLPVGWILGFRVGMGAEGMWIGLIAGLSVAALLLAVRFQRLTSGDSAIVHQ